MVDPLDRFRPKEQVLAQSVLDRLLDGAPDLALDLPRSVVQQVADLREAIRRDLESLLNTRRCPTAPPAIFEELGSALVSYGMDGMVSANLVTDQSKLELARSIERRISMFETRLSQVRVTILKKDRGNDRVLRMRIQAAFRLHDGLPPISFESMIDPSTQRFQVEAANNG